MRRHIHLEVLAPASDGPVGCLVRLTEEGWTGWQVLAVAERCGLKGQVTAVQVLDDPSGAQNVVLRATPRALRVLADELPLTQVDRLRLLRPRTPGT